MKRTLGRIAGFLLLFVFLAALSAGGALLVAKKKRELKTAPRYAMRPTPVHVAKARKGDLLLRRNYLAEVEAFRTAAISARLTAPVERIPVDEGDRVGAGDILLVLDGQEIRDGIASVDARIERAAAELAANKATVASLVETVAYWEREAARDRKLVEKGDIPASAAEATADKANEFRGRLQSAKDGSDALRHEQGALSKQREQLVTRLGYCTLRSPYDGIVTRRLVDPGDLAAPGRKLMLVEDRSTLKAAFDVPQTDLPAVREGLPVLFTVNGERREANLDHLFPSLDVARTLQAEVYLDERLARGLDTGSYLSLSVVVEKREGVTLVPAAALVESPDRDPYVFAVEKDHLRPVPVEVLGRNGEEFGVEGVSPGARVVTSTFLGWARLAGGLKVEAIR